MGVVLELKGPLIKDGTPLAENIKLHAAARDRYARLQLGFIMGGGSRPEEVDLTMKFSQIKTSITSQSFSVAIEAREMRRNIYFKMTISINLWLKTRVVVENNAGKKIVDQDISNIVEVLNVIKTIVCGEKPKTK